MDALPPIHGEDPVFLEVVEEVSRLAALDRPCLVVGERGTGKELLTSRIHYLSPRWAGPLIKINCAALTESLLESELFGHEAGAFTGAARRHVGRFERADGGTLVLDEIATASAAVQEKVLRVIEYGEFERVGGRDSITVDVRVVGATNVDLPGLARRGRFRADLLDRLAFEVLTIPPLRARPADVDALAHQFALEMTRTLGRDVFPGFSPAAMAALRAHRWPGNVRELKNVVERAVFRAEGDRRPIQEVVIDPFESPWRPQVDLQAVSETEGEEARFTSQSTASIEHPPAGHSRQSAAMPDRTSETRPDGAGRVDFGASIARLERDLLSQALQQSRSNQTRAAQALGLSYHQFRRLIAKHGLR